MSAIKQRVEQLIQDYARARPLVTVGRIIGRSIAERTVTVEAHNPTGPGLMRLVDLAVPEWGRGRFEPLPEEGSHAVIIFPDHDPERAQLIAVYPPKQDWVPVREELARPRTWQGELRIRTR